MFVSAPLGPNNLKLKTILHLSHFTYKFLKLFYSNVLKLRKINKYKNAKIKIQPSFSIESSKVLTSPVLIGIWEKRLPRIHSWRYRAIELRCIVVQKIDVKGLLLLLSTEIVQKVILMSFINIVINGRRS